MSYQGRKKYISRRERLARTTRVIRLIFIFAMIAVVVLLFKHRYDISTWLATFFK